MDTPITRSGFVPMLVAVVLTGLPAAHAAPPTDRQLVASAMRAAPAHVARDATVVTVDKDGKLRTVRKGSGPFTCLPDAPDTPGPDPMCGDAHAMAWVRAWMNHEHPPAGQVGFMYMLEGGTDASNLDPYAKKPQGAHWIKTGPHVMIVGADPAFYAQYPRSPDPDTSAPYVMWADTPYQHLMVPVH